MPVLAPELVWYGGAFRPDLAVAYDDAGTITSVAPAAEFEARDVVRLPDRALIPGFVNAHSHAFQRLIRGRTQWRPAGQGASDFWSWREAMYAAALALSPDEVYHVSRFCFIEMLRAGITSVGEFHYLHNDPAGDPYDDPAELARRVLEAARDAGIRIRLLHVFYARGGVGRPLDVSQRRFATPDVNAFLAVVDGLRTAAAADPLAEVGVAPHSIRAVPREWLRSLHGWAAGHDAPLHMHVAEQPAEVEACVGAYGVRPAELLCEDGIADAGFTAVHATHLTDGEVTRLGAAGATVCACPATERDLGDGVVRARDLLAAGAIIALGTDSQTVIDMLEEARLIEYHERLRRLERVVLAEQRDDRLRVGPVLLHAATAAGARSLKLRTGSLEAGAAADLVAIDLAHHTLAGWSADTLPDALMLTAPPDVIRDVWVAGRAVVTDRTHAAQDAAQRDFGRAVRRIFGSA